LRAVKAVGWWVEEYGMAQVSMNLDDFKVTPPHVAFEEVVKEARALKLAVAGSEIVGLVPLPALLMAADHYIAAEDLFIVDESQKIRLAADRLGLGTVSPFVPGQRVIEYMVAGDADTPLAASSVRSFVRAVGARTSAPGGGSASALIAAIGAALGTMVGWMTYGKRKFEDKDAPMRQLIPRLHGAMEALIPLVDADTQAFASYMEARNLPQDTEEQAAQRRELMEAGLQKAVEVPLAVVRLADACWDAMVEMARHGNVASRSDLEVGGQGPRGRDLGRLPERHHQPARADRRGVPQPCGRGGRSRSRNGPGRASRKSRPSSRDADRARSVPTGRRSQRPAGYERGDRPRPARHRPLGATGGAPGLAALG
jgi:glutamate formiminotransferase/formiminotetrahydrofolate cyclodeaminase